ncbi:helix-turn-helix domain-containing protein [Mesobacillus harenae]|uniref:helix-turn-helix domain-containing protein n=1 Tax=Mesobacillus harenae TaxID=2213203 RepID=UPI001580D002|nr:helix-turn-helix domain-containing protein [Mesobacillus harenae]
MSIRRKTIEELLDLEGELIQARTDEQGGALYQLVSVYEALFNKISADPESEYTTSLPNIKKKLINYLVKYGTYMKTEYRKDDNGAISALKLALSIEKDIPIAHYRLGFLRYKEKNYTKTMNHFQHALRFQEKGINKEYKMNDQQVYNTHLYLANSALFIAKETQDSLKGLKLNVNMENLPNYETSPLYDLISQNELYIANNAYTIVTPDGKRLCIKEECEELSEPANTIILDLINNESVVSFNGGKEVRLSKNHVEMLRLFLMESNKDNPLTKNHFYDLFSRTGDNGEILSNTYTRNITRLRYKLAEAGLEKMVIENKAGSRETAYFYNQQFPYLIMHRSDEAFLLSE